MMKRCLYLVLLVAVVILTGCSSGQDVLNEDVDELQDDQATIFLYGELHGVKAILDHEADLWYDYYHNQGLRDLFLELPYYSAEFLNLWMQADEDTLLDDLFEETAHTAGGTQDSKAFFKRIKAECPETQFYGTDVGHQYDTTGPRYLAYLEKEGLKASPHYTLAQEAIAQGKAFYKNRDHVYRENTMAQNFIRAYDQLGTKPIMGIYGAAHTGLSAKDHTNQVDSMAKQLVAVYGAKVSSVDLTGLKPKAQAIRTDQLTINNTSYQAAYYGKEAIKWLKGHDYREFWHLQNAYTDFESYKKTGDLLPYDNYPMQMEEGQVYLIKYVKLDGTSRLALYLSAGQTYNDRPATSEIKVPNLN